MTQWQDGYGVKIEDFDPNTGFSRRGQPLDPASERAFFTSLRSTLVKSPQLAMNELLQIAVAHCHADSSGISLEEVGPTGELQFRWVAVAGSFVQYLNGTTPRFYSPCGTCIDRGIPQRYQVSQPYYNSLGVTAQPIRDGLLVPWHSAQRPGTLWIVSHGSEDAFTANDFALMCRLADFVSAGIEDLPQGPS
ncbi:MAG: hypothetical protein WA634_10275 [Silvibacterium sp.]